MSRKPDPKSIAGFVRSLPTSTPAAEVVAKAKANGLAIDLNYVYAIRARANPKRATTGDGTTKRGPGRPRKTALSAGPVAKAHSGHASGGLVAEIERIVEAKLTELLKARLGSLLG